MLKSMNDALSYIESHLHDEIDNAELERIRRILVPFGLR